MSRKRREKRLRSVSEFVRAGLRKNPEIPYLGHCRPKQNPALKAWAERARKEGESWLHVLEVNK